MPEKFNLRNLDKSSWQSFRFEEVAEKISKTVKPEEAGVEIYVGLEHIDSNDIHIRRKGKPADVKGGKLRCYPGDVIFGKRRAYQRKAAIVDFEGICSAHAFVLRAMPEVIDPRLFPFFLHSDQFMHRMVDISVGGLSPTINWGDLKNQEFLLPPKEQQVDIAKLLWTIVEVIEKDVLLLNNAENQLDSNIEQKLHGEELAGKTINQVLACLSSRVDLVSLGKCGEIVKGKGIPKADVTHSGYPCVRYGELYTHHHRLIRSCKSFIDKESVGNSFRLLKNDVLFAGSGETIIEIGKSAAFISDEETYAGSDILIFRPNKMDGTYLGYLMNSQLVRQQLNKYGTGATVMHIYKSDLEKIQIPVADFDEQVIIGKLLEKMAGNVNSVKLKITSSKSLQKSLINQVF